MYPDPERPRPSEPPFPSAQPFTAERGEAYRIEPPRAGFGQWWLWPLMIVLLGALVYLQRPESTPASDIQKQVEGIELTSADAPEFIIMGKLILAFEDIMPMYSQIMQNAADAQVGWEPLTTPPMFAPPNPADFIEVKTRPTAKPAAADRLRIAILANESLGLEGLHARLDDLELSLDAESPLHADIALLRELFPVPDEDADPAASPVTSANAATSDQLDPDARKGFEDRHGWFAKIALAHHDPKAPMRKKAADEGAAILGIVMIFGAIVFIAVIAGVVLLIIGLVQMAGGRMKRTFRPAPRSLEDRLADNTGWRDGLVKPNVWFETLIVFLAGFLVLSLGSDLLARLVVGPNPAPGTHAPIWLIWFPLIAQWLLALAIFWPIFRGMSWERWRGEIGWHKGRGVFAEIFAGLAAYLAFLPLYFVVAIIVVLISLLIQAITGAEPVSPADNKIIEAVAGGGPWMLLAIYLLATIWAPIVEESIFRGAFFRHLRRTWVLPFAAFGSALVFAVLHGYVIQGLFMVGAIGFAFAFVREWRGSLIAPAFAHALHNGTVLLLVLTIMSFARP